MRFNVGEGGGNLLQLNEPYVSYCYKCYNPHCPNFLVFLILAPECRDGLSRHPVLSFLTTEVEENQWRSLTFVDFLCNHPNDLQWCRPNHHFRSFVGVELPSITKHICPIGGTTTIEVSSIQNGPRTEMIPPTSLVIQGAISIPVCSWVSIVVSIIRGERFVSMVPYSFVI